MYLILILKNLEKQAAFDFLKKFENVVKNDARAMTRLISGEIHLYLLDLNENGQCKEMDLVRVKLLNNSIEIFLNKF